VLARDHETLPERFDQHRNMPELVCRQLITPRIPEVRHS
jgi:hypothetical protein